MNVEAAMKRLGKNVKRLRQAKGLTQEKMREAGFNYRYYQKIEAGEVNATLDTLVRLARVFKCPLSELLIK